MKRTWNIVTPIGFRDLNGWMKTAIVLLWVIAAMNGFVFLVEFFRVLLA